MDYESNEYGMGRQDYERMGGRLPDRGGEKDRLNGQIWAIATTIDGMEDRQINEIIDIAEKLPRREAKNPSAIIAGFLCLKDGELNKSRFNKVTKKILPLLPSKSNITIPDILRYARLIKNQKSV